MTPESAADLLDKKLRPYPWYVSTGVGDTTDGAALFVYVKTARRRELASLADGWMGYKVVIRPVGSIRPARRTTPVPTENGKPETDFQDRVPA